MTAETLNERAAKVLGLAEPCQGGKDGHLCLHPIRVRFQNEPCGYVEDAPDFEHSIDAQRDLEAIAREAGWLISSIFETGAGIIALWYCPERNLHAQGIAPTEPEARAKALLAVFEIEQGEKS